MRSTSFREVLILFIVIIFAINFAFFKYGYRFFSEKKQQIGQKITATDGVIANELVRYTEGLDILGKIGGLKKDITKSEEALKNLKDKIRTDVQVSEVLKALILKAGISVNKVVLEDVQSVEKSNYYVFDVSVEGSMPRLLHLIDSIENKNELFLLTQYVLLPGEKKVKMDMKISTVNREFKK